MSFTKRCTILLLLLFTMVQVVTAQTNLAGIAGRIVSPDGKAIDHATITIKNGSTGFTAKTVSNEKGEFLLKELPLGGPYSIIAEAVGMASQTQTDYALNQGDLLRVLFQMTEKTAALQAVVVKSTSLRNKVENIGTATAVTAKDINRLPVNGRNFTTLADLSPLSTGTSLGGQLGSATNFTIDGMAARGTISGGQPTGAYAITMEAVREFQVVTNQYDVTYGNAGGGTISTVTKSGTNTLSGSAFTFLRTDWLSSPYGLNGQKRNQPFDIKQYGFSLGGPIIKDKAHFFVAWDHQANTQPLLIAPIQSNADALRYNVTQQTQDDFLRIARAKYGVANSPQFGQFSRFKNTHALFGRIDWQLGRKSLLTIRDNFIYDMDNQSDGDNTTINIFEVYSSRKSINNSVMASLRTTINPRVTNELKLEHYWEYNKLYANPQLPADNIPRATVSNIASVNPMDTAKRLYTNIQLGGQRYGGDYFNNSLIQLVDNIYINTDKFNFTLGGGVTFTHQNSIYGSETNGRFWYTGLAAFDNLQPYRFTRDVYLSDDHNIKFNILSPNVYAQAQTTLGRGLTATAGVRIDYTDYLDKANFNQAVYNTLSLNTSNKLATLQVQPRVQFTWDVHQNGKDIVRLGGGILGSALNPYSMINNMLFDGSHIASIDVTGSLVPTPNFPGYRQNPSSAPGKDLVSKTDVPKLYTINMNGKDAKVPIVYKINGSYSHFFSPNFRMSIAGYLSFARNNYTYLDKNMVDQPYFTLSQEGNRPVYVPAATINTSNGSQDWTLGRKTNQVGRVLQLESVGKVNQAAVVIDGDYRYYKDGEIAFSYTWNQARDNTSYNGNVANTATLNQYTGGDPRDLSLIRYSDNHFRSKIVIYGNTPSFHGFNLGVRFSGLGGTRYSMYVNGNINGDFVETNDLAYVADPNSAGTPQYMKDGLNAILNNPNVENSMKTYLRKSFGKIAESNGGVNPFYGTVDLRLTYKVKVYRKQYIELSGDLFNVANLLNKSWGVNHALGATSLLSRSGFDAATNNFRYAVNTNAGVSGLSGNPYQFQLGIRYGF
ncbi:carboxypeptidase regulatory-like domain-containing protein [Deminuibacter soli]|uniref:TonB-dependent receptor n=1 Tax=Deminuibacter soli TaxID=2291815 RepID=A0A3E1NIN7_9BACT|nr:carboxypeptidase regulatory-like domain-containing protein [Deminuibacter soli]RFM27799.1 TonB-dependent receptor [Deminuibacter soli]